MSSQIPIQGSVAYEKVVYETEYNRIIDTHYLGDHHDKQSKCVDVNAMTTLSFLQDSLKSPHVLPIDVFVEIGLGVEGKARDTYLNELVLEFQKKHCLKKGVIERTQCEKMYPDVRFHCVDFRQTLYLEYNTIIEHWWLKENGKNTNDMNHLLHILYWYMSHLVNNKSITLPYTTEFKNDREMQRIAFVYDMVVYREKRYQGRTPLPFAPTLSEFLGDLYYLMCSSPSAYNKSPVHPSPVHTFYPRHIQLTILPYYTYRLMHEYRNIPEFMLSSDVQRRFDVAIKDRLDYIRKSTPQQFEIDTHQDNKKANLVAATHLSWLMDMYLCFRSLKPYVSHIVVVLGVDHIKQIKQFMTELGITFTASPLFDNPDPRFQHGAQCISIPVDATHRLTFDDNVFPGIIPTKPAYHGKRSRIRKRNGKQRYKLRYSK